MSRRPSRPARLGAAVGVTALATFTSALPAGAAAADVADPAADACPSAEVSASLFADIAGNLFELEIRCLADYGITQGTTPTTYSPSSPVTRQQMVVFLARLTLSAIGWEELEGVELEPAPFTDLTSATPEIEEAVDLLWSLEIMRGTTPTTFDPAGPVTRAQMASMLDRVQAALQGDDEGFPTPTEDVFADDNGSAHEESINAIAAVGIAGGVAPGRFVPEARVTRAQMAAFLMRHVQVAIDTGLTESAYEVIAPGAVQLTVSATTVAAGQPVQARLTGCQPQQVAPLGLVLVGGDVVIEIAEADEQGVATAALLVPADAEPGGAGLRGACIIDAEGTIGSAQTLVTVTG